MKLYNAIYYRTHLDAPHLTLQSIRHTCAAGRGSVQRLFLFCHTECQALFSDLLMGVATHASGFTQPKLDPSHEQCPGPSLLKLPPPPPPQEHNNTGGGGVSRGNTGGGGRLFKGETKRKPEVLGIPNISKAKPAMPQVYSSPRGASEAPVFAPVPPSRAARASKGGTLWTSSALPGPHGARGLHKKSGHERA